MHGGLTQSCIQNCYRKAGWNDISGNEDGLPLSVWLQQKNIEQFYNLLNLDEYNNFDDDVLNVEHIVMEVVKAKKQLKANYSMEEETVCLYYRIIVKS